MSTRKLHRTALLRSQRSPVFQGLTAGLFRITPLLRTPLCPLGPSLWERWARAEAGGHVGEVLLLRRLRSGRVLQLDVEVRLPKARDGGSAEARPTPTRQLLKRQSKVQSSRAERLASHSGQSFDILRELHRRTSPAAQARPPSDFGGALGRRAVGLLLAAGLRLGHQALVTTAPSVYETRKDRF